MSPTAAKKPVYTQAEFDKICLGYNPSKTRGFAGLRLGWFVKDEATGLWKKETLHRDARVD